MLQAIDDVRDRVSALAEQAADAVEKGRDYAEREFAHGRKSLGRTFDRSTKQGRKLAEDQARRGRALAHRQADQLRAAAAELSKQRVSWVVVAGAVGVGFVTALALANSRKAGTAATNAFSGDWMEGLAAEHRKVERLFKSILATSDAQVAKRAKLLEQLDLALTRHALEEEHVIYPALRDSDQGAASNHLAAEHFDIKTYLHELDAMPKDDPKWIKKVRAFQQLVREHVREEEEVVFPPFRERLSPQQNGRLTRLVHREGLKLA